MNRNGMIARRDAVKIAGDVIDVDHTFDEVDPMWFDPLGIMVRDKDTDYAVIRI
jgi:hypothetical protein